MKQLVVNQLEGGFVVQTVVDGKQESQSVAVNYGQVIKKGRAFFEGEELSADAEPHVVYDSPSYDGEFTREVELDAEIPPASTQTAVGGKRRGRPLGSRNAVNA